MTLESALVLAIAVFLLVIKPGPFMVAVISRSVSHGFACGFAMSAGNVTMQVIFFLIASFGSSIAASHLGFFSIFLKTVGAAYIIYLGVKGLNNLDSGLWQNRKNISGLTIFDNVTAGMAITLANPFAILFYVAFIPQIMNIASLSWADIVIAAFVIAFTTSGTHTVEILLASRAREVLKNPIILRRINIGVSCVFIAIGIFLGLSMFPIFNIDQGFTAADIMNG
jgi:threonine/homoserine/homoserine lactone efflux protein